MDFKKLAVLIDGATEQGAITVGRRDDWISCWSEGVASRVASMRADYSRTLTLYQHDAEQLTGEGATAYEVVSRPIYAKRDELQKLYSNLTLSSVIVNDVHPTMTSLAVILSDCEAAGVGVGEGIVANWAAQVERELEDSIAFYAGRRDEHKAASNTPDVQLSNAHRLIARRMDDKVIVANSWLQEVRALLNPPQQASGLPASLSFWKAFNQLNAEHSLVGYYTPFERAQRQVELDSTWGDSIWGANTNGEPAAPTSEWDAETECIASELSLTGTLEIKGGDAILQGSGRFVWDSNTPTILAGKPDDGDAQPSQRYSDDDEIGEIYCDE